MVEITNSKVVRTLKNLSIEQLRLADDKLAKARKAIIMKRREHRIITWKLTEAKENTERLRAITKTIMGQKKGEHCLALCQDSRGSWTCKAKKDRYWFHQKHDVYETACARCRYKVKTKRDKMVFGQIFSNRHSL